MASNGSTTLKRKSGRSAKERTSIDNIAEYVHQLARLDSDAAAGHMIASSYVNELRHADRQQARWKNIYYEYRGFVIVASAVIAILTGLNLQGNTSFAIRVATVVLGGLITVASGLLELLQVNNRWRLYRHLRAQLEAIIWRTAAQDPAPSATSPLAAVGRQLLAAMQDFERHYVSQVATTTDQGDRRPEKKPGGSQQPPKEPASPPTESDGALPGT